MEIPGMKSSFEMMLNDTGLKEEDFLREIDENKEIEIYGNKVTLKQALETIEKQWEEDVVRIVLKKFFIEDIAKLVFEYYKKPPFRPKFNFWHSPQELAWVTYQMDDEVKKKMSFEEFLPKYEKHVIEDRKDDCDFTVNPLTGSLMVKLKKIT